MKQKCVCGEAVGPSSFLLDCKHPLCDVCSRAWASAKSCTACALETTQSVEALVPYIRLVHRTLRECLVDKQTVLREMAGVESKLDKTLAERDKLQTKANSKPKPPDCEACTKTKRKRPIVADSDDDDTTSNPPKRSKTQIAADAESSAQKERIVALQLRLAEATQSLNERKLLLDEQKRRVEEQDGNIVKGNAAYQELQQKLCRATEMRVAAEALNANLRTQMTVKHGSELKTLHIQLEHTSTLLKRLETGEKTEILSLQAGNRALLNTNAKLEADHAEFREAAEIFRQQVTIELANANKRGDSWEIFSREKQTKYKAKISLLEQEIGSLRAEHPIPPKPIISSPTIAGHSRIEPANESSRRPARRSRSGSDTMVEEEHTSKPVLNGGEKTRFNRQRQRHPSRTHNVVMPHASPREPRPRGGDHWEPPRREERPLFLVDPTSPGLMRLPLDDQSTSYRRDSLRELPTSRPVDEAQPHSPTVPSLLSPTLALKREEQ